MLLFSQFVVVAKGELRVVGAHLVDLVAADEADIGDAGAGEGGERLVEQAAAVHFGVAFRSRLPWSASGGGRVRRQ